MPSDQHREHRDQRQRDRDDHRGDPVRERDPDQHRQRDRHGQHQLRQVPGEVGVQPVQPPGRERRDLPGLLAAEPGGPSRRAWALSRRRSPDFTTAAARSAAASPPAAAAARPASTTPSQASVHGQRADPVPRAAPARARDSRSACSRISTAPARPSVTATARYPRAAPACRSSRGSTALTAPVLTTMAYPYASMLTAAHSRVITRHDDGLSARSREAQMMADLRRAGPALRCRDRRCRDRGGASSARSSSGVTAGLRPCSTSPAEPAPSPRCSRPPTRSAAWIYHLACWPRPGRSCPAGTPLYQADMTSFTLSARFDAIVCAYQGVNHLLSLPAWKSFFGCAYEHLNAGGVFVFDIATVSHLMTMASIPKIVQQFAGHLSADKSTYGGRRGVRVAHRGIRAPARRTIPAAHPGRPDEIVSGRPTSRAALRRRFTGIEVIGGDGDSRDQDGADRIWLACAKPA